ncbi:MAG: S-layer homology domain-containing protein [Clostridiales bacterium]|nr:S-layer homology domain-containing protein [Clostridiales bacterium]
MIRKINLRVLALALGIGLVVSGPAAEPVSALSGAGLSAALKATAEYVHKTVENPQIDMTGGDWAILGLARSGYTVPRSYYDRYYRNVEKYVKDNKGVLDERKYTEYSRVVIGLTAAGFDPRDVAGYDLTEPLGDFEKTIWQGLNGPIYALIALDGAGFDMPESKGAAKQATRDMYIAEILGRQLADGGFALSQTATASDPDITAMALQALSKYQDRADVKASVSRALSCLSLMRGGVGAWSGESVESVAQAIVALCELGLGISDARFVVEGMTLADKLMEYAVVGGGFAKTIGGVVNQMSTEQALYALAAIYRMENAMPGLYDMRDVGLIQAPASPAGAAGQGLPGKHGDVKVMPVTAPGKSFGDILGYENRADVEALAARGIIGGKSEARFEPEATMTRAEFASIITRALGLTQSAPGAFDDVKPADWFYESVGIASKYGLVNGVSDKTFSPAGLITREEAAAMVARAAGICGMSINLDEAAVRDMLAQFGDYRMVSGWAQGVLAFCYKENILSQDVFEIKPKEAVTRGEIAGMLRRMLEKAELI